MVKGYLKFFFLPILVIVILPAIVGFITWEVFDLKVGDFLESVSRFMTCALIGALISYLNPTSNKFVAYGYAFSLGVLAYSLGVYNDGHTVEIFGQLVTHKFNYVDELFINSGYLAGVYNELYYRKERVEESND